MNEILLEYYAGKSKELIRCESYLEDIRRQILQDNENEINIFRKRSVYRSFPANEKLEKELADFFGFKQLKIYWGNSTGPNAGTIKPLSFQVTDNKSVVDKRAIKVHIMMNEELVTMSDMNARELLAILLREIGHNFYYCPIYVIGQIFFSVVTLPFGLLSRTIQVLIYKGVAAIDDILKKYVPVVGNAIQLYKHTLAEINGIVKPFSFPRLIATIPQRIASITLNPISVITGYGDEKGADSFAAKYGYGSDLVSALHKLDHPPKMISSKIYKNSETITVLDDFTNLIIDLIGSMTLDPHPNTNQRAQSLLKKLKADLTKADYPIEMKRDLEKEIARMEKVCETVTDSLRPDGLQVRKSWYTVIDKITEGHSDIREIFNFYYDSYRF